MKRRNLPSLNALKAFEAAARCGRMVDAAEELSVTHGAVSRQVRQLEEVLQTQLFEGPKNRLRLTEAGERLLPSLTAAFDQIEASLDSIVDREEGALDVSCLGTFTMRWLIPRLYRFAERHPAIEVRLSASHQPVDFKRDAFDVAIRWVRGEGAGDAVVVPLFDEYFAPVLSPDLAARFDFSQSEDLSRVPLLHTKTRRSAWADWCAHSGQSWPRPEQGTEFEHFYYMLEAATAGLGMAIAPWPLVTDDIRAGRLLAPFGFTASGYSYVALRRARRNRKADLFCAWLQEEAEASFRAFAEDHG